ncbi:MAG: hypothetical protein IPO21_02230 [Bacteroidales bacterium]|nr:hypothetical protein [Bacteroidales bacterium]
MRIKSITYFFSITIAVLGLVFLLGYSANATKKQIDLVQMNDNLSLKTESQDIKNTYSILLPTSYRIFETDPLKILNKSWFELYSDKSGFFIKQTDCKIEKGLDECSGLETKTIKTSSNTILLIGGSKLQIGKLLSVNVVASFLPGKKSTISFNNKTYTLQATGIVRKDEKLFKPEQVAEFYWDEVENYVLSISSADGKKSVLIEMPGFKDTAVTLLFAGDIDKDGLLDLIFSHPSDYEEQRVSLFLSSQANGKEIMKMVDQVSIQFDC